ncbi:hypothetical protein N7444_005481 [Penicillium canescens]|nr:hypothetical protein N7444_005481 [Penicillium canescens]
MSIRKTLRKWINKPETSQQNDYSFAPTAKPDPSSPASIESTPEKLASASSVNTKPPSSSVSHSDVGPTDIPPKDLDLWTLAYEKLEQRDQELMHMYKQCLGLSLQDTSIADLSSSKSVSLVVDRLLDDREKKRWHLSVLGKDIEVRKQVEKLQKFILWSDPLVKDALSAQPYAALAWTGVSLFVPLLASGMTANADMLEGFNKIDELQIYWYHCARVYLPRYPSLAEHISNLYSHIIEYQALAICHLSKKQPSRGWSDVAGQNDWNGKVAKIEGLSTHCNKLIKPNHETLEKTQDLFKETQNQQLALFEEKKQKERMEKLASSYEEDKNFPKEKTPGTCNWLIQNETFCKWRDSLELNVLRVSASPGCGKSVLSRALIDLLQLSTNLTTTTICYFFFKDGISSRVHAADVLRAILHQTFMQNRTSNAIKTAVSNYDDFKDSYLSSFPKLWSTLINHVESPHSGNLVCVVDALDECKMDERKLFIDHLKAFYRDAKFPHKLKFLVTTRPYVKIESLFWDVLENTSFAHVEGDRLSTEIREDINMVIDARVKEMKPIFRDNGPKIASQLRAMENGTYLWLHLVLDIIEKSPELYTRLDEVQDLFSSLPRDVSDAYDLILKKVEHPQPAEALLQLMSVAERPLTLVEANSALALTLVLQKQPSISFEGLKSKLWGGDVFEATMKSICGLFVTVYHGRLFFIHQTAREFLTSATPSGEWKGRLNVTNAHRTMSIVCLSYLRYVYLSKLDINCLSDFETLIDEFPLAIYSAWFWTDHARLVDHESIIQNRSLEMLQQTEFTKMWPTLITAIRIWHQSPATKASFDGASGARQNKLNNNMRKQFATDKVKHRAPGKEAPLYIASAAGMQNVVHLLLKADEKPVPGKYLGALEVAALNGQKAVVESLLISELMMATPREYLALALKNASREGHDEIVELLLHHRAPTNAERFGYGTTL